MDNKEHELKEHWTRSLVKALTYRIIVLIMDFTSVYLFTGKIETAVSFMLVSNVYTSITYFIHERVWDRITWGK